MTDVRIADLAPGDRVNVSCLYSRREDWSGRGSSWLDTVTDRPVIEATVMAVVVEPDWRVGGRCRAMLRVRVDRFDGHEVDGSGVVWGETAWFGVDPERVVERLGGSDEMAG